MLWGRYRTRRFVFPTASAESDFVTVAAQQDWNIVLQRSEGGGRPRVLACEAGSPGLTVWYFEDSLAGVCGVHVDSATSPEELAGPADVVQANLGVLMLSELLGDLDRARSTRERCAALRRAGYGATVTAQPSFLDRFTIALIDPDVEVRIAAVLGITCMEWPSFVPVLDEAARSDADRSVRRLAAHCAYVLRSVLAESGRPDRVDVPDLLPHEIARGVRGFIARERERAIALFQAAAV